MKRVYTELDLKLDKNCGFGEDTRNINATSSRTRNTNAERPIYTLYYIKYIKRNDTKNYLKYKRLDLHEEDI